MAHKENRKMSFQDEIETGKDYYDDGTYDSDSKIIKWSLIVMAVVFVMAMYVIFFYLKK